MDSLPIVIPAPPAPTRRPPLPFVAAVVPVLAGVVLWLVTGSLFSLCFAALGPLMLFASLLDGVRTRRRDRRRADAETEAGWRRAEGERAARAKEEREHRWQQQPDAARALLQPPLRTALAPDAATMVVVGRGTVSSSLRTTGGDDDRAREFQVRAGRLDDAPIAVPLGRGLCLRGPEPIVSAVLRGLVVQLALRFGPGVLSLVGETERGGFGELPHVGRARRGALRLAIAATEPAKDAADAVIWALPSEADVPEGITTVVDCAEPQTAILRTPQGVQEIAVEGLSVEQTRAIAAQCADRVADVDVLPDAVRLYELEQRPSSIGLAAVIGRGERDFVAVDLVEDGPHAIVTGTTGTGKSELLISWVTAIAQTHGPDRVTFVLADFKGGTAFEPLSELPQVSAVITDLDEAGARRGVSSLTAELRRREGVLASAGARDIREVDMPRLVIVVDEFAALLQEHPDLGAVFTDIAARGRALGMHLVLGTQRAAGVIRDALAANCPLRLSLRVGDPADSRFVLGTDAAAELPGGIGSRGLALIRRPQDAEPIAFRVALTGAADLRRAGMRWARAAAPASPWLPPLPRCLPLADLAEAGDVAGGAIVLGRADDPDRQMQPLETLTPGRDRGLALLGGAGSGKTAAIRLLAAQHPRAIRVPEDLEQAWDLVVTLSERPPQGTELILCDDLDRHVAALPPEHAQHLALHWERILRAGAARTVVITASRAAGLVSRMIDALPTRALLRMPSRVEHLAAGGEPSAFERDRMPGRARIGDREVQLAWLDPADPETEQRAESRGSAHWHPHARLTGLVTAGGVRTVVSALAEAHPDHDVLPVGAEADGARPALYVGDGESWQRRFALWQRVRTEGEVLVRAECPSELRQLAGVRELPPYAHLHEGRAWSVEGGGRPRRVVVPALATR